MGIFNYKSNDEEFSELIKSLQSLPKVKADDNFEYKLMIKIQNQDFSLNYDEKSFNYKRGLIPVAAFAFSVVLVFFIISDSSVNLENPLLKDPPARQISVAGQADTIEIGSVPAVTQSGLASSQTLNDTYEEEISNNEQVVKVVVQPNDVVTTVKKEPYPFDQSRSLDLDIFVTGQQKSPQNQRGVLVGGASQSSPFDGFLIREKPSQKVLDSHKARLDSLKNSKEIEK